MTLEDLPEEPHFRSELSVLSPASPKPIHFPAPTNIPVLNNMMDVDYNQTELHMQNPAMRNTEIRDGAWKETETETEAVADPTGESSAEGAHIPVQEQSAAAGETLGYIPESAAEAKTEHVTTPNNTNAVYANAAPAPDAPTAMPEPTSHLDPADHSTNYQDDMSHGQTRDTTHDDSNEPPSSPKQELAPDAEAFLSQIQNVAIPSNLNAYVPGAVQPAIVTDAGESGAPSPPGQIANGHNAMLPFPLQSLAAQQNNAQLGETGGQSASVNPETVADIANHPISLQSLFPSGTLPADLAASLMHGASLPFAANAPIQPPGPSTSVPPLESRREQKLAAGEVLTSDDERWTADVQQKYDEFIHDERRYVNEGRWDSFPQGSRLFVGNLSSESVTKRDIFHVFHSYGRLAQISIKQAFGFVQFLVAEDCTRALEGEQGRQIKDKKIHLEISKPQKPRNQGNTNSSNNRERRSRSPEHRNTGRADRYSGGARSDRDGQHRGGYRSPSPRGGYRDRYDDRYRNRSRTPPDFARNRRYGRSPSPRGRGVDDDLPLPKRAPQDVPEVQVIVIDNLDRDFVGWVEKSFAARGIRVAVLLLSPRLDEQAVVRRQILEGVLAVSKLARTSQMTRKIDLQIFDRRGGQSNVRFEEYSNLDPATCAELVLRAKSTHAAPPPPPTPVQYGYSAPATYMPPSIPPQYGYAPPPVTPQYSAAPAYAPPYAAAPQFSYPPVNPYGAIKVPQQSSAPPQIVQPGYAAYPPPQVMQPVSYQSNPGSIPPPMMQQQGPSSAGAQPAPVDMQQILARLGSYNK